MKNLIVIGALFLGGCGAVVPDSVKNPSNEIRIACYSGEGGGPILGANAYGMRVVQEGKVEGNILYSRPDMGCYYQKGDNNVQEGPRVQQ